MEESEPVTAAQQIFELICRFHHLRLPERAGIEEEIERLFG